MAMSHSTKESFQESYNEKQKQRKHPKTNYEVDEDVGDEAEVEAGSDIVSELDGEDFVNASEDEDMDGYEKNYHFVEEASSENEIQVSEQGEDEMNNQNLVEFIKYLRDELAKGNNMIEDMQQIVNQNLKATKGLENKVALLEEEFKKRNGAFADILVPEVSLPVKNTEQYDAIESRFKKKEKIKNNMV